MVVGIIVIVLFAAVVIGLLTATADGDEGFFGFWIGFVGTIQVSLFIGAVYVAVHFISKYW